MSYSSPIPPEPSPAPQPAWNPRWTWFTASVLILTGSFFAVWREWFRVSQASELHSYLPLIPFLTGYLAWTHRSSLTLDPLQESASARLRNKTHGAVWFLLSSALLLASFWMQRHGPSDPTVVLDFRVLSFCTALYGVATLTLGSAWLRQAAFPAGFLLFLTPLPEWGIAHMETFFQHTSADAADLLIRAAGIPVLRDDLVFQLPNITLQVAPQCSGIRSSWMLVLTSVLASRMLLNRPLSRWLLVLFVIPLGILRNGFRILVLAWLCVEIDPSYIDSSIHHQGGPVFFALSLIPFALFVWILRRWENPRAKTPPETVGLDLGLSKTGKKASSH